MTTEELHHVRKNGKKKGKQNYICVDCGRQFIDAYEPRQGYSEEAKRECLKIITISGDWER